MGIMWTPQILRFKIENGDEEEINTSFIFYIEYKSENRQITIHLTESKQINNKATYSINLQPRKYGIKTIMWQLEKSGFIQINRTTLVRKVHLSGLDAKREYVYITMPSDRTVNSQGTTEWKNIVLHLGRKYKTNVEQHIFKESLIEVKDSEGDTFFICPIDIAFIKIKKSLKTIYLERPICHNNKNLYEITWQKRKPIESIFQEWMMDYYIKVHRNYYVNFSFPFKLKIKNSKPYLIMDNTYRGRKENKCVNDCLIPVSARYKSELPDFVKKKREKVG